MKDSFLRDISFLLMIMFLIYGSIIVVETSYILCCLGLLSILVLFNLYFEDSKETL